MIGFVAQSMTDLEIAGLIRVWRPTWELVTTVLLAVSAFEASRNSEFIYVR
jgi:hypothetical protein